MACLSLFVKQSFFVIDRPGFLGEEVAEAAQRFEKFFPGFRFNPESLPDLVAPVELQTSSRKPRKLPWISGDRPKSRLREFMSGLCIFDPGM
jgi:hypothetical protein